MRDIRRDYIFFNVDLGEIVKAGAELNVMHNMCVRANDHMACILYLAERYTWDHISFQLYLCFHVMLLSVNLVEYQQ